jgi:hypothetical protein
MNCFRTTLVALSVATLLAFAGEASANLILNPGFEDGIGADAADWAELGGAAGSTVRDGAMPSSGSFAAHMSFDHNANPPAAGAYFIEQNQGANVIDNSVNLDLTFDAKVDSTDFTGMDTFYQVLWLDQDGSHGGGVKGEKLTSLIGAGINTGYQTFGLHDINVPDGADSFLLRFQISSGPVNGIANGLWVDNVSLSSVVPEPASWCLLVMGGLVAVARRRRK